MFPELRNPYHGHKYGCAFRETPPPSCLATLSLVHRDVLEMVVYAYT